MFHRSHRNQEQKYNEMDLETCRTCKKRGHKENNCWFRPVQSQIQERKNNMKETEEKRDNTEFQTSKNVEKLAQLLSLVVQQMSQ